MPPLTMDSFQILLNAFHKAITDYPPIENIRKELEEIKEAASLDGKLTDHQKSAIRARCDNYMNNQYGDQRKTSDNRSEYQKKLN